ncbi:MAG: hypothetical protein ACI9ZH_000549 [Paracoccaceae bacterium]|jgi:hypothetical protein
MAATLALPACARGPAAATPLDGIAPLPGPERGIHRPDAPAVRMLADGPQASLRGWVVGPGAPVGFILKAGASDAPPILFLGGDRKGWSAAAMTPIWHAQATAAVERAEPGATILTLGRPYAGDPERWRTRAEIDALAHAIAELSRAFGFGRADLLGHSSGAHLAVALAQEKGRVRLLAAASPPLDLMAWHQGWLRHASRAVRRQYDPIARVAALTLDAAVLVADPRDTVTPPEAWRAWLSAAIALGKPVSLAFANGGGEDRHGLVGPAAEALATLRASAAR